jgi:hypothetical protein
MNPPVAAVAVQPSIRPDAKAEALRNHRRQHRRRALIGWLRHARESAP